MTPNNEEVDVLINKEVTDNESPSACVKLYDSRIQVCFFIGILRKFLFKRIVINV